jgi:hypothetical protein
MKKLFFIFLVITISCKISYSQTENEKYDAVNTYLMTLIKDPNKTTIIVKEKISTNQNLKLFAEGKLNDTAFERRNGIQVREGGILEPLYDETDFQKMRQEYQDDADDDEYGFSKNSNWKASDFKLKNIFFESQDTIQFKKVRGLPAYKYETEIIALSDPIYYKGGKYLVISIAIQNTNPVDYFNHYVIVMAKVKNKWEVIQRGQKYWYN